MNGQQIFKSTIKDYLLLLTAVVVSYWPISLMVFSLKNDAINYFLALRYNTSEAIQNGYFPFWLPYIDLGYPAHGDMQSGVWNPLVLILSLVRRYDIYWLHVEVIVVLFIATIGMYQLLRYLLLHRRIVLCGSIAYLLCGFLTDSGQFINWLYAGAYFPFVFLYLLKVFTRFRKQDVLLFSLFYSLLFLSGYPAFFILTTYLIAAFIICRLIQDGRQGILKANRKQYINSIAIASLCFILVCLPAILSYTTFLPRINRGNGATLEAAVTNSLAPSNLLSFLFPFATQKGGAFAATDPLMRNCYIGLLCFAFLLWSFFSKKQKSFLQCFLLGTFLITLLFSLGKYGGIRQLVFYTLPLLNTFRHPACAKLFFIFFGLLLALFQIDEWHKNPELHRYPKRIAYFILALTVLAAVVGASNTKVFSVFAFSGNGHSTDIIKTQVGSLSFYDHLFINSIIQLPFLVLFIYLLNRRKRQHWLLLILFAEMWLNAQLMLPLTYYRNLKPSQLVQIIEPLPDGYPEPDVTIPMAKQSQDALRYFKELGSLNFYNKKPGRPDYPIGINPSQLILHQAFWDDSLLRNKAMQYPFAYLADTLFTYRQKQEFLSTSPYIKAALISVPGLDKIMVRPSFSSSILTKTFVPNRFEFNVQNSGPGLFVLQQNSYPNWRVLVNGKQTPIILTNKTFMGVALPAGTNQVVFYYEALPIKWAASLSLIFTASSLLWLMVSKRQQPA